MSCPPTPGSRRPSLEDVAFAKIHPSIGIARVGNSPDGFFFAPEVVDPPANDAAYYRDARGALKRQVARFRVYGYDRAGKVVAELVAPEVEIVWAAHVANSKAAWYETFDRLPLDLEHAVSLRRRYEVGPGKDRTRLVIDAGLRQIAGENLSGPAYQLDRGRFDGLPVSLGELRTDNVGRLLFFGGAGQAGQSSDGIPFDDISDGPITAKVRIGGRTIRCEPAWVLTAPPNFAPELKGLRTLYDLALQTAFDAGLMARPSRDRRVSFAHEVFPILRRMCDLQWVNAGFARDFGWGGVNVVDYWMQAEFLAKLATAPSADHAAGDDPFKALRAKIFEGFRNPQSTAQESSKWPRIVGDELSDPKSPRRYLALCPHQWDNLKKWAAGEFENDQATAGSKTSLLEDLPVSAQPALLDRASLSFCLADAFRPGIEVSWPLRCASIYSEPFRIKHAASAGLGLKDAGPELTAAEARRSALQGQGPGGLTRWTGVPWQQDLASCGEIDETPLPPASFWPARAPNQILSEANYAIVLSKELSREERWSAFSARSTWCELTTRNINQNYFLLGLVLRRPGPDDGLFPETLLVEIKPSGKTNAS